MVLYSLASTRFSVRRINTNHPLGSKNQTVTLLFKVDLG